MPLFPNLIAESNGNINREINDRMGKTGRSVHTMKYTFLGKKKVPRDMKIEIVRKVVRSASSKRWTLADKYKTRLTAMEMRFLRHLENNMEPVNEKIIQSGFDMCAVWQNRD